jgi:hypothetical protein
MRHVRKYVQCHIVENSAPLGVAAPYDRSAAGCGHRAGVEVVVRLVTHEFQIHMGVDVDTAWD